MAAAIVVFNAKPLPSGAEVGFTQDENLLIWFLFHYTIGRLAGGSPFLFWVAPTGKLWELFQGIHDLDPQTGEAVAALAAQHEVEFLPPPDAA